MGGKVRREAALSSLRELLVKYPSALPILEAAAAALDAGGAVVPGSIKLAEQRELFTSVLRDMALKERDGAYFFKHGRVAMKDLLAEARLLAATAMHHRPPPPTISAPSMAAVTAPPPRPVVGPMLPPSKSAHSSSSSSDDDDDDEAGPFPMGAAARRPVFAPQMPLSQPAASAKREAWMSEAPTEEDGKRHMRQEAMTSQKGRGFSSSRKRDSDAPVAAAAATSGMLAADKKLKEDMAKYDEMHRAVPLAKQAAAQRAPEDEKAFKWDYESMMNDNTIDKERSKALLTGGKESIDSRFAPPQSSRRFL